MATSDISSRCYAFWFKTITDKLAVVSSDICFRVVPSIINSLSVLLTFDYREAPVHFQTVLQFRCGFRVEGVEVQGAALRVAGLRGDGSAF